MVVRLKMQEYFGIEQTITKMASCDNNLHKTSIFCMYQSGISWLRSGSDFGP